MDETRCPRCASTQLVKSGIVNDRQRFKCKQCRYFFTVKKLGKRIDPYYIIKALQLYLEGLSYREIERLLGVSHVSVMNWVKQYKIQKPENSEYHPTYKVLNYNELIEYIKQREHITGAGTLITEVGDKFMIIRWERFKKV